MKLRYQLQLGPLAGLLVALFWMNWFALHLTLGREFQQAAETRTALLRAYDQLWQLLEQTQAVLTETSSACQAQTIPLRQAIQAAQVSVERVVVAACRESAAPRP